MVSTQADYEKESRRLAQISTAKHIGDLQAEIARLRALLQASESLKAGYLDEVARLRALLTETGQKAIECAAENERLRGALKRIAMQQKTDELEEPENADFEGGYDAIIEDAREALGQ